MAGVLAAKMLEHLQASAFHSLDLAQLAGQPDARIGDWLSRYGHI